jgi:hypothetical protein
MATVNQGTKWVGSAGNVAAQATVTTNGTTTVYTAPANQFVQGTIALQVQASSTASASSASAAVTAGGVTLLGASASGSGSSQSFNEFTGGFILGPGQSIVVTCSTNAGGGKGTAGSSASARIVGVLFQNF